MALALSEPRCPGLGAFSVSGMNGAASFLNVNVLALINIKITLIVSVNHKYK